MGHKRTKCISFSVLNINIGKCTKHPPEEGKNTARANKSVSWCNTAPWCSGVLTALDLCALAWSKMAGVLHRFSLGRVKSWVQPARQLGLWDR